MLDLAWEPDVSYFSRIKIHLVLTFSLYATFIASNIPQNFKPGKFENVMI